MDSAARLRVTMLCDLSKELQKLGPMYLAIVLVEEAFARQVLEVLVFGKAEPKDALNEAVVAVDTRLRRVMARSLAVTPQSLARRQERSRRTVKGLEDLGERMKLRAEGKPLSDRRRRKVA